MNKNQEEFCIYWDKVKNVVFYGIVNVLDHADFKDRLLDNQRTEISSRIKREIERTFFDSKARPEGTVWFEHLQEAFPEQASEFERRVRNCKLDSKGSENIAAAALGGTAVLTGITLAKKSPLAAASLILAGAAGAGYKLVPGLGVDTQTLQREVEKQFEAWKTPLLGILEDCTDSDESVMDEDE